MQNKVFIHNQKDNLHCLQACYAMVMNSLTTKKITMKQAELDTGFKKGALTWDFKTCLSLARNNLKVTIVDNTNYKIISNNLLDYIKVSIKDKDLRDKVIESTNIKQEQSNVSEMLDDYNINLVQEEPCLKKLTALLNKHMVIANLNHSTLSAGSSLGKDIPHCVLVKKIENGFVVVDDPGLPARENHKICLASFLNNVNSLIAVSK